MCSFSLDDILHVHMFHTTACIMSLTLTSRDDLRVHLVESDWGPEKICAKGTDKQPKSIPTALRSFPERLTDIPHNLWLLTKDDNATFVIPNTVFGICAALAGSRLITYEHTSTTVLTRLPWVFLFNWLNLLIFDLANQRLPESAKEDALNKPWRPVPSGRMTSPQIRQSMLLALPLVLAFNHYVLTVGSETALIYILTWMYNDLRGGDEGWILRNVIISFAFAFYNIGSLKVAATGTTHSTSTEITSEGYTWVIIISGVILTTMHVQDLKDQAGDRARGRKTAPLVLGDLPARWTIAAPMPFWTAYCAYFWHLGWLAAAPMMLGTYTAWRCVAMKGKKTDRRTWQLWCLWTAMLYMMPLVW